MITGANLTICRQDNSSFRVFKFLTQALAKTRGVWESSTWQLPVRRDEVFTGFAPPSSCTYHRYFKLLLRNTAEIELRQEVIRPGYVAVTESVSHNTRYRLFTHIEKGEERGFWKKCRAVRAWSVSEACI